MWSLAPFDGGGWPGRWKVSVWSMEGDSSGTTLKVHPWSVRPQAASGTPVCRPEDWRTLKPHGKGWALPGVWELVFCWGGSSHLTIEYTNCSWPLLFEVPLRVQPELGGGLGQRKEGSGWQCSCGQLKPGLRFSEGWGWGWSIKAHPYPLCGAWGQGVAGWVGYRAGPLAPWRHS